MLTTIANRFHQPDIFCALLVKAGNKNKKLEYEFKIM